MMDSTVGANRTDAERLAISKARGVDSSVVAMYELGLALLDNALPETRPDKIPRPELVARQALVQARNTLRAAWLLLFDGFEVQALALARLISEYIVLAWYIQSGNDPTPWLDPSKPPPPTGQQLRALETSALSFPRLALLVAQSRGMLNRLAHQDPVAFSFAYRVEAGRPSFFRAAGHLDAVALRRGAAFLLPLTLLTVQTAAADVGPEWTTFERRVDAWWDADELGSDASAGP